MLGSTESSSSRRCIEAAPRWISATTQPMMTVGKVSWYTNIAKVKNSATVIRSSMIR
jgi:hypothetical protein